MNCQACIRALYSAIEKRLWGTCLEGLISQGSKTIVVNSCLEIYLAHFNSTDYFKQRFVPFYASPTLSKATDVNLFHDREDVFVHTMLYSMELI